MIFVLSARLANAEMQTREHVACALRNVAHDLDNAAGGDDEGIVRDPNGNTVGRWYLDTTVEQGVREALEGDSNDEEHDQLVGLADMLGIAYNPNAGWENEDD